jgi:hypothetical protein
MSKRSKQAMLDIPDNLLVILVRCEECGKGHWAPLLRIKQGNWVCLNNGCSAVDSFVYEGRMGVTTERMLLEELKKNEERLRKLTSESEERVFLAEELRANGDDSSEFVIAITTNEKTEDAAYERAEEIAGRHNARILALHDGYLHYRMVRE